MTEEYAVRRYQEASALLPETLQQAALSIPRFRMAQAEELRLRVDRPLHITLPDGETPLLDTLVTPSDLEAVMDKATEFSRYIAAETICQGYLTAPGGFRVGLCGTALFSGERNTGLHELSSLAIRIPRLCRDIALPVLPKLLQDGKPVSTLILSPPGGGKTTLLRDLVRLLSQGTDFCKPLRVSLVDERGELAALYRGRPQLEVGPQTDILEGCPKHLAVPILLRAMNPQVIALDELATEADIEAVSAAANCGALLIATAHASSLPELAARRGLTGLLTACVFQKAIVISGQGHHRTYRVEVIP